MNPDLEERLGACPWTRGFRAVVAYVVAGGILSFTAGAGVIFYAWERSAVMENRDRVRELLLRREEARAAEAECQEETSEEEETPRSRRDTAALAGDAAIRRMIGIDLFEEPKE